MYLSLKRIFDFIFAFIALLILSPLLIPIIFLLKFTGEGEVFYFQKRIGKGCEYFDIWKFATMLKDSPNIGTGMITLRNDPRVTKVGKILRKSKINELPQIVNILLGDMSIVGPRPTVKKHADAYGAELRDKIYKIKPGLTGIGSIIFRDEEELLSTVKEDPWMYYKSVIIPYKAQVEIWYQQNQSFQTDIKIIIATAWIVLFPASEIVYRWFSDLPKRGF